MEDHKPADSIQDIQYFGEYGGVNPSITDSSTFTYMAGKTMEEVFGGEREGCYLYSRHMNPSTAYLAEAISDFYLDRFHGLLLIFYGIIINTSHVQLKFSYDFILLLSLLSRC